MGGYVLRIAWIALTIVGVLALLPSGSLAQWKTRWEYEGVKGPEHWSDLDPDFTPCNAGKQQSPVDIRNTVRAALPALSFEYKSGLLQYLVNNGYTIRVNYHDAPGSGNFLIVGGRRFQLTQFHFHHPSEEHIRGKPYEMDIHLMHTAGDGKVAGVAVLVKEGKRNDTIQPLWDHIPQSESKVLSDFSHEEKEIAGVAINPTGLLPRERGYYTYMGSVTAPPCTEGVEWFVLKTPLEMSAKQIEEFARLYPHDVRPLQPLNGRVVKESR